MGFYFAPSQAGCLSCTNISNCETCTSSTYCTKCQDGFYQLTPRLCAQCSYTVDNCCPFYVANCARCSSVDTCLTCATAYYFPPNNNLNNTCLSCPELIPNCA